MSSASRILLSLGFVPNGLSLGLRDVVDRRNLLREALPVFAGLTGQLTIASAEEKTLVVDRGRNSEEIANGAPLQGLQRSRSSSYSDEVSVVLKREDLKAGLGLELVDVEFRTNLRVVVKRVQDKSLANSLGIQKGWIFIGINGQSTERTNSEGVARMLASVKGDSIELAFRDPEIIQDKLRSLGNDGEVTVSTMVAPAGDTTQSNRDGTVKIGASVSQEGDQKLSVTQLEASKMCKRAAKTDDLMEISYVGRVVETGEIFDGSTVKINGNSIPGRGDDVSLYFVLGKQPFGQFPPGWDVGLVGMCVGERRRLVIPPALAYGSKGVPRRKIPPDATLQYDITLFSLNGLSTP